MLPHNDTESATPLHSTVTRIAPSALWLTLVLLVVLVAASGLAARANDGYQTHLPMVAGPPGLLGVPVATGFTGVTAIANAGDDRLFVGQRSGEIYVLAPDGTQTMYLDLSPKVIATGSEYGFYDIAFHPDFAANGQLFVTYTGRDEGKVYLVLARYLAAADGLTADPDSEAVLLRIRQDTDLHKGGGLDFDQRDQWLYMGVGEDAQRWLAQDPVSLKGKVLRLFVNDVPAELTGNAEGRAPQEQWAMGFRNPWRLDVDEVTGQVFVADVGSGSWEEVNAQATTVTGTNFGWPCREGPDFFPPGNDVPACLEDPILTDPLFAYSHDFGGCAIIGGSVYRPVSNPTDGRYVFADLCTREVFALATGATPADPNLPLGMISNQALLTLGEDAQGNLYAGTSGPSATVYQLLLP